MVVCICGGETQRETYFFCLLYIEISGSEDSTDRMFYQPNNIKKFVCLALKNISFIVVQKYIYLYCIKKNEKKKHIPFNGLQFSRHFFCYKYFLQQFFVGLLLLVV